MRDVERLRNRREYPFQSVYHRPHLRKLQFVSGWHRSLLWVSDDQHPHSLTHMSHLLSRLNHRLFRTSKALINSAVLIDDFLWREAFQVRKARLAHSFTAQESC